MASLTYNGIVSIKLADCVLGPRLSSRIDLSIEHSVRMLTTDIHDQPHVLLRRSWKRKLHSPTLIEFANMESTAFEFASDNSQGGFVTAVDRFESVDQV
jgi:hypothetical protein